MASEVDGNVNDYVPRCFYCNGKTFADVVQLSKHVLNEHFCWSCFAEFKNEHLRALHFDIKHNLDTSTFSCGATDDVVEKFAECFADCLMHRKQSQPFSNKAHFRQFLTSVWLEYVKPSSSLIKSKPSKATLISRNENSFDSCCFYCSGKRFNNINSFATHLLSKHFCTSCLCEFSSKRLLAHHFKDKHGLDDTQIVRSSLEIVAKLTRCIANSLNREQFIWFLNEEQFQSFLTELWIDFIDALLNPRYDDNETISLNNGVPSTSLSVLIPSTSVNDTSAELPAVDTKFNYLTGEAIDITINDVVNHVDMMYDDIIENVSSQSPTVIHSFQMEQRKCRRLRANSPQTKQLNHHNYAISEVVLESDELQNIYQLEQDNTVTGTSSTLNDLHLRKRSHKRATSKQRNVYSVSGKMDETKAKISSKAVASKYCQTVDLLPMADVPSSVIKVRKFRKRSEFPCNICGLWASSKSLMRHIASHLVKEANIHWLYKCLLCQRAFSTLYWNTLVRHLEKCHRSQYGDIEFKAGVHFINRKPDLANEIAKVRLLAFPRCGMKQSALFTGRCNVCDTAVNPCTTVNFL